MDRSRALMIIPQKQIETMATAEMGEIVAMLQTGIATLGHAGLRRVELEARKVIFARYPNDPRDPFDLNGWRQRKQLRELRLAIDAATMRIPADLADAASRVREAQVNYYVAEAEWKAYEQQRKLERLKAQDEAEAQAAKLLASDGAHQTNIALRKVDQPHEIEMKNLENVVPIEVTRMKTHAEIEVATVKGYHEAQVSHWRALVTILSAEKDAVKLGELFADFLEAAAIIDREREMHSPLYATTTDPATGAVVTEMNMAEARYRSQAKHDDLRRIIDTWQKTIGKGR